MHGAALSAATDGPPRARVSRTGALRPLALRAARIRLTPRIQNREFFSNSPTPGGGGHPHAGSEGNQDLRVHADVPRIRAAGARRRLHRDCRVVRDARQGGEVPRRPLREGAAAGQERVADLRLPIADQPDWSQDPHGMAYDNPRFWDSGHLDSEVHRVFEICNGCRLCFNLCPSFDVLFKRIDALDPHRAEAEGKHLEGGMVEEHEAKKLLDQVEVHTESPVSL